MKFCRKSTFIVPFLLAGLTLSACSTVGKVTDAINPFDGKSAKDSKVKEDPDRISILSLDEKLTVSDSIQPSEVVLPPAYTNTDWAQVGGYPTHAVQHTDASGPLKKKWSRDVGKGSYRKGRVIAPPIVAGGRIYVEDGANKITALDEETGKKIWEFKVKVKAKKKTRKGGTSLVDRVKDPLTFGDGSGKDKEAVGGGLAVADGRVFITSGFGLISALDANTGEEIWRTHTRAPMQSAPTIENGRLFAISDDNEIYALNADTGEVQWTYQAIIETVRMLTVPSPAVLGDVVVAPFSSGEIIALRVQNGSVLWQDGISGTGNLTPLAILNDIPSGPVIADGYVFASSQSGSLVAFDLRTGQRVWAQPAGTLSFPLIAGDFIFTVTTEGEVACMSKTDGTVVWLTQLRAFKKEKSRKKRIAWMGPILAGNRLILMSSRGKAVEINPQDGTILREFKLSGDVFVPPVIANNTIYYISDDAKLVALK